ncbi:MAG: hypothetical protein GC185_09330 [Alphaproteobacteria bacterium]|nr:hypothetical protein [Alphaproteobacteria bacterium]
MMTLEEFRDQVDLYSADLSRWPEGKVKEALALVNADEAAKEYFEAARAAEEALRAYDPLPADTTALESRIMAAIAADPVQDGAEEDAPFSKLLTSAQQADAATASQKPSGFKWRPAYIFAPGGGLIAAAVLGFIIGVLPHAHNGTDYLVDPVYYAQDQIIDNDSDLLNGGLF